MVAERRCALRSRLVPTMSSPPPTDEDVFQRDDPWSNTYTPTAPPGASAGADDDASADASRDRGRSRAFATGAQRGDPPPIRVIHDNPPTWNGDHPEKELEPKYSAVG